MNKTDTNISNKKNITITVVGNLILYSQKWIDHSDREYKKAHRFE